MNLIKKLYEKLILDEVKSIKKRWKGVLTFLIVVCGVSYLTGVKLDSIVEIVVLSFAAFAVTVTALAIIFREKKE